MGFGYNETKYSARPCAGYAEPRTLISGMSAEDAVVWQRDRGETISTRGTSRRSADRVARSGSGRKADMPVQRVNFRS